MTALEFPELGLTVLLYGGDIAEWVAWESEEDEDE